MSAFHRIAGRRAAASVLALATTLGLVACPRPNGGGGGKEAITTPEETRNATDPQWVVRSEPPAKVAVVFVHGLFGDTIGTWTHANGKRFFDLVSEDPALNGRIDILAFGYPSHMFESGSFDIQAAAKALHARLEHHGILGYSKVVFVGHSMGGLVIMRELLMNRAVMPPVPVIVLLATPQEGSDIARIADYIARNPALSEMSPADDNKMLQLLNDDWHAWPDRPKVRCGYENKDTRGLVRIVEWSSSTRFCDASVEISADHIEIAKPDGPENLAVIVVTNALKEYVFNPALDPRLETPDFVSEGDHSVFQLSQSNIKLPAAITNSGGSALQFSLVEPSDRNTLLLWPDRPQSLPANGRDVLFVYLSSAATQPEYRFKLRTDYGFERSVVVRPPPDLAALRAQELQGTVQALLSELESDTRTAAWLAAPAENGEIPDAVVQIVRDHTARERPDWPEGLQWVVTADVLNGLNWPGLAARALRQAESAAPELIQQESVQHLAAITAAQSGDTRIFATTATPTLTDPAVPATPDTWLAGGSVVENSARLAAKLEAVPALQFYGLSLTGDVKKARGDQEGARAAYQGAAVIRPAPSVTRRLQTAGGWRATTAATGASGAATGVDRSAAAAAAASEASGSSTAVGRDAAVVVIEPEAVRPEAVAVQPERVNRGAVVVRSTREHP